jgi:L-lysine exporter family protein LysE/ArgO
MLAFLPGLLTGLSLIIAIGAQNAFVIRQGLTRKYVLMTVLVCIISDITLMAAGVAGLGAIILQLGWLLEVFRWFGVLYLLWFAYGSVKSAFKNVVLTTGESKSGTRKQVLIAVLSMTWLNPHVYLDTVILVGSIANTFKENAWYFGFGAMLGSVLWFFAIGFGAKAASGLMSKPSFWKILDLVIAAVMVTIAGLLAFYRFN